MSYIGSTPTTQSFIAGTDSFNGTGSATNFTLSRFVNSVNDVQVVVNNVVQYPPNYSVSGNTLTISPAPSAGTNNVYVRYLSTTLQSIAPSQGIGIQFGIGSLALPSISFIGDPNTGIYSPAADTIAFVEGGVEAMRIDSSANVGIGTTSPSVKLDVSQGTSDGNSLKISNEEVAFFSGAYGTGASYDREFLLNASRADSGSLPFLRVAGQGGIKFCVDANTERARINSSGNLCLGTTSVYNDGLLSIQSAGSGTNINTRPTDNANYTPIRFCSSAGNTLGTISATTSAVAYNTSSDYRLKHDIQPMTGALAKVAQLNPVTYKWNADNSESQGFIAHELQAVVPDCVTGEKDAVDADGNPVYQGIDTSFLVATLTAAIQEQQAMIDTMKQEIAELKAKVGE